jgi:arsenate reductase
MAEAFLNSLVVDVFEAQSAGIEPGTLNPLAVEVMKEVGIDISGNMTKSVFDFYKDGKLFSYVITVCDAASSEMCPIFHWSFEDPALFTGSHEERLEKIRKVRDAIRERIKTWIKEITEKA